MRPWTEWYMRREIAMAIHVHEQWDVWICSHCNRAVSQEGACICTILPALPTWEDVT